MRHRDIPALFNHIPYCKVFANAAERTSYVVTASDEGKLALQTDTGKLWLMTTALGVVPPVAVTASETGADPAGTAQAIMDSHEANLDPHPLYLTVNEIQYIHDQATAEAVWTINHNTGRVRSVTIVDSAGTEVEGDVAHNSLNQVTISFSSAFAGKAYLN